MNRIDLSKLTGKAIPFAQQCSQLNTPFSVCSRTLRNRIVFQPMEGADSQDNGAPGELTKRRYTRFAESGAGIIWFEAVAVCDEGRANPHQLCLTGETAADFKKLVSSIKETSRLKFGWEPIVIMQATHSGRQSRPKDRPEPIYAYHNEIFEDLRPMDGDAHMITDEECDELGKKYYDAASLAADCGFDGIDVKCCHGYLVSEFLSARNREGRYGGSLENRARLYFSCFENAKKAADEKGIFLTTRLGVYEGFPYPWGFGVSKESGLNFDMEEPAWVIGQLRERFGVELINLTIGNPYVNPNVNRPYNGCEIEDPMVGVERIAAVTKAVQKAFPDLTFVLSGTSVLMEKSLGYAAAMMNLYGVQLAGFGRMTLAYPAFWQDYLKNGYIERKKCCAACGKCTRMMRSGGMAGCPVRDREVYVPIYEKYVKGE